MKDNDEGNNLTKKEWLEYIDKLITRDNAKNNRSGITIWVIIGALSVLLVNIIDLVYNIRKIDFPIVSKIYCFLSLLIIIIYIIVLVCLLHAGVHTGLPVFQSGGE